MRGATSILTGVLVVALALAACDAAPVVTDPPLPAEALPTQPSSTSVVATEPPTTFAGLWAEIPRVPGFLRPDLIRVGASVLVLYGATSDADFISGSVYDPVAKQLSSIDNGGLEWRAGHVVAPAGGRVLVFGGSNGPGITRNGLYDPATDEWVPVADSPVGLFSAQHSFWTGSFVLALPSGHDTPFLYDPAADSWSTGAPNPFLEERSRYAAVWTGREVILWGGCDIDVPQCDDFVGGDELTGGVSYDPATDEWRELPGSPLAPRDRPTAVWTGAEMLVWGGNVGDGVAGTYGAAYNPSTDAWRELPEAPISARSLHSIVWTGSVMIVWGGGTIADGAAFDPATNTWLKLPSGPLAPIDRHAAIWIGDRMLIFGGFPPGPAAEFIPGA